MTQRANPTLTKLNKICDDLFNLRDSKDCNECYEEEKYIIYRELKEVIRIVERKAYLVQKLRRKIRAMKKRNLKFREK